MGIVDPVYRVNGDDNFKLTEIEGVKKTRFYQVVRNLISDAWAKLTLYMGYMGTSISNLWILRGRINQGLSSSLKFVFGVGFWM